MPSTNFNDIGRAALAASLGAEQAEARKAAAQAAESRLVDILERNGMLGAFIDQVRARDGLTDHYRDTPLGPTGPHGLPLSTTGSEAARLLKASNGGTGFHLRHALQNSEGLAMRSMDEAHGKAPSLERFAPALVRDPAKQGAERELFEFRSAQTQAAIPAEEGAPPNPKACLSAGWRERIANEAVQSALGKTKGGISPDWPQRLGQPGDFARALEAMRERQQSLKGARRAMAVKDGAKIRCEQAFAAHMDGALPSLERAACARTQEAAGQARLEQQGHQPLGHAAGNFRTLCDDMQTGRARSANPRHQIGRE
jgi:hypothetical protein